jgi:hypothetical protein
VKERSGTRVTISRDKVEFPVEMADLAPADILKYAGCHADPKLAAEATAYLAMRGDVGEAFKWVEKVEDEPEKARLALKLEALSKGAEQAVVDHMMDGLRRAYAEKDWNDVRSRAAALAEKFGATEPCRKAKPEIDKLLLETAEAESGGLASFIHGKVRKLDGLRVEIRYDFLTPAEYGDWLKIRGSGAREGGGLALESTSDACARPFMRFESVEIFEFDAKNVSDAGQHLGWSLGDERNPYVGAWGWLRPNGDSAIEAQNVKIRLNPRIAPQKDTVYRMLVEVKGAVVAWTIDGKPVGQWDSKRQDIEVAYPYVNVFSSKAIYSNIRIVGTLDRAWTEKQFAISKLCKEQDLVPGLYGEYWNGNEAFAGKPTASRRERAVDFDWGMNGPADGVGGDGFCARFSGKLYVETAGDYTFNCEADDGARVFLDGKQVWEGWGYRGGWQPFEVKGLTAGLHDIKVEMHEGVGGARCRLDWESKDLKRGRVPAEVFFCPRSSAGPAG